MLRAYSFEVRVRARDFEEDGRIMARWGLCIGENESCGRVLLKIFFGRLRGLENAYSIRWKTVVLKPQIFTLRIEIF